MASSLDSEAARWARTASALLAGTSEPWSAAQELHQYLLSPASTTTDALRDAGISIELVNDFRPLLPEDPDSLALACQLGAAFEFGRRDQPAVGSWRPVATWVGELEEFQHRTAETLLGLLIRARRRIRIFAPFIDESALVAIAPGISAASNRGALIDLAIRRDTESLVRGLLPNLVEESGDNTMLRITVLPSDETFPHLKLFSIDGKWAYVGSANLTWAALIHNVELGVLVDGEEVQVLERLYDELIRDPTGDRPSGIDGSA